MGDMPVVKLGDWVEIGTSPPYVRGVVCSIYDDQRLGDIEVVYIDVRDQAINEDVVWNDNHWEFKSKGQVGGYADRYSRLNNYVSILRNKYK